MSTACRPADPADAGELPFLHLLPHAASGAERGECIYSYSNYDEGQVLGLLEASATILRTTRSLGPGRWTRCRQGLRREAEVRSGKGPYKARNAGKPYDAVLEARK